MKKNIFEKQKESILAIQTSISTTKTDIAAVKTDIVAVEASIPTTETDIAAVETDIVAVEASIPTTKTDIAALQTNARTLETSTLSFPCPDRDKILVETNTPHVVTRPVRDGMSVE